MVWVEHVAGSLAREVRDLGFLRVTILLLTFPGLVVYGLASTAIEVYFPSLHALPRQWRERRYAAKMDRDFRNKFGGVDAAPATRIQSSTSSTGYTLEPDLETRIQTAIKNRPEHEMPKDLFFGRLPPEIRRQILVAAFGDHIIHVDLQYRHPYHQRTTPESFLKHTKHIIRNSQDAKSRSMDKERWRWFSCVCHNHPTGGGGGADQRTQQRQPVWLSHGRRTLPSRMSRVNCLEGVSQCERWQGSWPEKCHVGAMGWLLTSRQAYMEGVEVLYRTNTFNIASPILLRSFHNIIPRQMRIKLCSLTLVWDLSKVKLSESFSLPDDDKDTGCKGRLLGSTRPRRRHKYEPPLFPSLRYLRIALDSFARSEKTLLEQGLPKPLHREDGVMGKRLHDTFYPRVEELLDRLAPTTTEITFTVSDWELYERIDLDLVERQGEERTRLQRSELGGLKCWKERRDDPTKGYWIHIGTDYMGLDQTATPYDWERHKMYGLGEDKYECTWQGLWREGFVFEML